MLLAAALLLRVLVPAGFMPMETPGGVVLTLCSGHGPAAQASAPHHGHGGSAHHAAAQDRDDAQGYEARCAFADLALPAIGGAGPALLAAALAFVMARALRRARILPPRAARHLRPPSHAPPLPA